MMQALSLTNRADYYPFGMPMPNRQTTDGDYRYAYQGQEKDKETNKEAFELRLWDARIGRWLTTDPYGEFASPYLGMGNNPISLIDPDGGQTDCPSCPNSGNDPLANAITSGLGMTGAPDHAHGGFANSFFNNYSNAFQLDEIILGNNVQNNYSDDLAILLLSTSLGITSKIGEFSKITNAINNNTFLSSEFNKAGKLSSYKLGPNGVPSYKGGGSGGYKAEDIAKAASQFKGKANIIKGIVSIGIATNVVGVGLSVHQVYLDGELNPVNGIDTTMSLVAFVPGIGWIVSSSYSAMRATIPLDYQTNVSPSFNRFGE
ncbi:RHS repeat-associated core domain-containing protein [Flavobacteriaceae bacterium]|nr:RHS repeat-associated core domain-containing protein [Flavobacteriaceae bacterium]